MNSRLYSVLFEMGKLSGCHQRPDRSFFYKGRQFPVCARCTGAFIGYFFGGILAVIYIIPWWLALVFCAVMFFDWFVQRIKILESNNIRRLITGALCGFALMQMYLWAITLAVERLIAIL